MKANELMIGDWVEVINSDHLKYVKVRNILDNSIITEEGEYESEEVKLTNIKSIPLTEEILESNGFVRYDKHEYSVTDSNYNYLKVRCYADTNFEIGNAFDEEGELQAFADIQYVHELQHALRLCGIDKNIEL